MDLYKWLYTYLTPWWKKPWTHVRRAFWHKFEILNIYFYVGAGFALGFFFWDIFHWLVRHPILAILVALGLSLIGVLQGHFFWNKNDSPGEIDEDTDLP